LQLLEELKENDMVLPIMPEDGRAFLAKLEEADIPYIGTPFDLGVQASHKAKYEHSWPPSPPLPQTQLFSSNPRDPSHYDRGCHTLNWHPLELGLEA